MATDLCKIMTHFGSDKGKYYLNKSYHDYTIIYNE